MPDPDWGTPVDETAAPAQASAWGVPVDEGDSAPAQPVQGSSPGWRDRIMAGLNDPKSVTDTGFLGQAEQFGQGVLRSTVGTVLHPIDAARAAMIGGNPANSPAEMQSQLQGTLDSAKAAVRNPAQALGGLAGGVAMGDALPAARSAANDLVGAARNFRPVPSQAIVSPAEQAARTLTNAIGPDPARAPSYIKAAQVEVPNVIDYARRTDNPLRTQIEFAKAAEGNAKEAAGHYNDNILNPNANERAVVPDNSGVPKYSPQGENPPPPTASLKDINQRIIDINKELNKPRLNAADQRTALAAEADLQAEHSALTDILHRSLSDLTGIPPGEIADLRQRVGRSYELANDTNAAVTRRGLQEGKPAETIHGLGMGQLAMKALDLTRGGPTAITDRAFQSAIRDFPGSPQPLPKLGSPRQAAAPIPAPRTPLPRPAATEIPIVNTADPAAQAATRDTNLGRFENSRAAQQAAADAERDSMLRQQRGAVENRALTHEQRMQNAQRQTLLNSPNPDTHQFSPRAWQAANPDGDVRAATDEANGQGFEVIE